MPSKSKAQAHLMAAAAHNPEIAKDTGIDQSVAHDFNKADEKDGNLKSGSDLPMHVSEDIELNEASGVGIIKVPQALLQQVQKYVGSVLLTMGVMKQHELVNQNKTDSAEALMNYLRRFQRKYGASVLLPDDLKKYINSSTNLNIDANEIYNALPENLKNNPRTKELIDNLTIKMKISNQFLNKGGSSGVSGTHNNLDLGIPSYEDIKNANLDGVARSMNYAIGTVEHELQHTIQQVVNQKLNAEAMSESSMRGLADVVQDAELHHEIIDADEQELINKDTLEEMPQKFDAFAGQDTDEFVDKTAKMNSPRNMDKFSDHGDFYVMKSKNGTGYIAYDKNGNQIAVVSGNQVGNVFHEESIAAKNGRKGIVYQIYMDILNDGKQILSDTLHSDSAIRFWEKLITNHEVYVVADGEVLQRATPEKFHKYWSEDENSPQSEFQLLLVK